jgi:hypothetical protein
MVRIGFVVIAWVTGACGNFCSDSLSVPGSGPLGVGAPTRADCAPVCAAALGSRALLGCLPGPVATCRYDGGGATGAYPTADAVKCGPSCTTCLDLGSSRYACYEHYCEAGD